MTTENIVLTYKHLLVINVRRGGKGRESLIATLPFRFCKNVHIEPGDMLTIGIIKIEKGAKT